MRIALLPLLLLAGCSTTDQGQGADSSLRLTNFNIRYGTAKDGVNDGERIDAVLLASQWQVESAAIVRTQREGRIPSDHYPVSATVRVR